MTCQPVVLDPADLPLESFADSAFGTVHWRTLFSGDRTPTEAITCGLATLEPGAHLALHRHAPPEIYFCISGTARVVVEGTSHTLRPGMAVIIPANAVHGIFAEDGPASFFYVFPRNSFSEVEYNFLPDAATRADEAMALAASAPPPHPAMDALDLSASADTPQPA